MIMMNKNKDYYKLIKSLPLQDCPEGFTRKVILASGILEKSLDEANKRPTVRIISRFYAAAYIITIFLILAAVNLGIYNGHHSNQERLAINTLNVGNHLSEKIIKTYATNERSNY